MNQFTTIVNALPPIALVAAAGIVVVAVWAVWRLVLAIVWKATKRLR